MAFERVDNRLRTALQDAERLARRHSHSAVDTPHILLAIWQRSKFGRFPLAAFGLNAKRLKAAVREQASAKAAPPDEDDGRQYGLTLPLTARAARAFVRASEFIRARDVPRIDEWLLLRAFAEEPDTADNVLAALGVDVAEMCYELWPLVDLEHDKRGTPRLIAYDRSRYRGLLGWARWAYERGREWIRPSLRVCRRAPTNPLCIVTSIMDRARCRSGDEFVITSRDFPEWLDDEVKATPGFDVGAAFQATLRILTDDERDCAGVGSSMNGPDPTVRLGGKVRVRQDGETIRLRVTDRRTWAVPAPHKQVDELAIELAAAAGRVHARRLVVTADNLAAYLTPHYARHPEFSGQLCFAALVAELDQPWDAHLMRGGPVCCGLRPPRWVYTDGQCVYVTRWLAPWTRLWLWRRHRTSVFSRQN